MKSQNYEQKLDVLDFKPIQTLKGHSAPIYVAKFNKDGQYLMTGSQDRTIILWNPYKPLQIKQYSGIHNYEILDIAISDDNSKFATCGGDKLAFFIDVQTGNLIRKFSSHQSRINSCAIGGETAILATAGYDCEVKIWDLKDKKSYQPVQKLKDFKDSVTQIQFEDHQLITSSIDGHMRYFDIRMGRLTEDYVGCGIMKFSISTDQKLIALSCLDSKIRILERSTGQILTVLQGSHRSDRYSIKPNFSWDDGILLTGSEDGKLVFYNIVNQKLLKTEQYHMRTLSYIDMSAKKDSFVTAGYDGICHLWQLGVKQ